MLEKIRLEGEKDQTKREKIRLKSADPRLERRQNGSTSSDIQRQTSATAFTVSANTAASPVPQIREKRCVAPTLCLCFCKERSHI